jgi:endonuclease/exonuclease/phosphatase family metal-dependent hydrolase
MRLRLMAYNVHGFRAGWRRVAEALEAGSPDVVLLNEAGFAGLRLWRLARRLGMERASGFRLFGRGIPNAVMARAPWRIVARGRLAFPRHRRRVRRGAVVATLGRAGRRLTAVAVHLGLGEGERADHARILTDELAALDHPVVIGGDLNEGPSGPAARWIGERYWDVFAAAGEGEGPTFPARDPRARIDYLFASDGLKVERAWVAASGDASDHLLVAADVRLGE